jgi:hypothetical protein
MRVASDRHQAGREAGVFRRHVLYIPGYDPVPAAPLPRALPHGGGGAGAISGYRLAIQPRAGETYGWRVAAEMEGRAVEAEVEVLVWSDLVKGSMGRGIAGTYGSWRGRPGFIWVSGALIRLIRLRKGPMIAALYPAVALVAQALAAVLVAGLVLGWWRWLALGALGWLLALGGRLGGAGGLSGASTTGFSSIT